MCYDEGLWQAYLDNEVDSSNRAKMMEHLESCPLCRNVLAELEVRQDMVGPLLGPYREEMSKVRLAPLLAWERFVNRELEKKKKKGMLDLVQAYTRMLPKKAVAAAVVVILGSSLFIAPVRGAAAQFLQVFRAERITTVSISINDLQEIQRSIARGAGKIDLKSLGQVEISGKREVKTLEFAETQALSEFPVAVPSFVPEGFAAEKAQLAMPVAATFLLDVNKVNQLIQSLGGGHLLPDSVAGQSFSVTVPQSVTLSYQEEGGKRFTLTQGKSPQLGVPEEVDMEAVREAVLELPILPQDLKSQLAGIGDWRHTLVIPSMEGAAVDVNVNGNQGVYIQHGPSPQVEVEVKEGAPGPGEINVNGNRGVVVGESNAAYSMLVWQEDDVIYTISGNLDRETALQVARSLRK